MRRAFLSLYGLIVLSVIAVGWGLDELWHYYSPPEIVAQQDKDTFVLIEGLFSLLPESEWQASVASLNQNLDLHIELIAVEEFAKSNVLQNILTGELVVLFDDHDDRLLYKMLQGSSWVIRVRYQQASQNNSLVYDLLLMVFYGAIALVVFLWVWPLSRDLSKLEKHTKLVGQDKIPEPLYINPASTVYHLSSAFNRMAQRVRDLLASHKEMTYAVSHELRTPLARMKFALEMAENCKDSADIKNRLQGVRADVGEMDSLVNQLLSYAAFEQNDQPLDLQEGDLNCLVEQLINRIGSANEKVNFVFNSNDSEFSKRISCEWHLMERAVSNLLLNAQRHAASKVEVVIGKEGDNVQIMVSDDGPGVPEQERERIFQSFVRLQTSINAQARGFGLGLAIVQRVMRWHNGEVKVIPSKSGGACFVLNWPIAP